MMLKLSWLTQNGSVSMNYILSRCNVIIAISSENHLFFIISFVELELAKDCTVWTRKAFLHSSGVCHWLVFFV